MNTLRDIGAAFGWLTVIPARTDAGTRPVRWFPLVGWALGAGAGALAWAARSMSGGVFASALVGWAIVGMWALLTRFLHWDGLADTADAMWGAFEPERRLEIMHDSHTGAFGALAVAFIALGQVLAAAALVRSGDVWALVAAPVIARAAASAALWTITPARADGLAARLGGRAPLAGWLGVVVLSAAVLAVPTPSRIALALVGVGAAVFVPRLLSRAVGGITGDILGASILLVETIVLVSAALITGV